MAEVSAKLNDLVMDVIGSAPDEFARLITSEIPLWAKAIKEAGVQPE
jgi:hypothetical protein